MCTQNGQRKPEEHNNNKKNGQPTKTTNYPLRADKLWFGAKTKQLIIIDVKPKWLHFHKSIYSDLFHTNECHSFQVNECALLGFTQNDANNNSTQRWKMPRSVVNVKSKTCLKENRQRKHTAKNMGSIQHVNGSF